MGGPPLTLTHKDCTNSLAWDGIGLAIVFKGVFFKELRRKGFLIGFLYRVYTRARALAGNPSAPLKIYEFRYISIPFEGEEPLHSDSCFPKLLSLVSAWSSKYDSSVL